MAEQRRLMEDSQQQASSADREQRVQSKAEEPRSEASETPVAPGQAKAQPSGYRGDNPSTAGPGQTAVNSATPENKMGHLNPSAPEDANVTPGSTAEK